MAFITQNIYEKAVWQLMM